MDTDSESRLLSLITQLLSRNTDSDDVSLIIQTISLVSSMDLDAQPKPESELMSLITQAISLFNSMDLNSQPEPLTELISLISQKISPLNYVDKSDSEFMLLYYETFKLEPKPELISLVDQTYFLAKSTESKLLSLISHILSLLASLEALGESKLESKSELEPDPKGMSMLISIISLMSQLISIVSSLDFDSQPKPESEVMSLTSQIVSLATSISDSDPHWELISLVTQLKSAISAIDPRHDPGVEILLLMEDITVYTYSMDPDSELASLLNQLLSHVDSADSEPEEEWEPDQFISLSPQLKVQLVRGKFHVKGEVQRKSQEKRNCQPENRKKICLARGEDAAHFYCKDCNGDDHEECEKTPVEVKHPLHPKHHLQLVVQKLSTIIQMRKCFCCDEDLAKFFYYCSACDYAMNIACAGKPPVLSIDHPKWHEHPLVLFPRQAFLTCNVCALADVSSPIYMCPPCDFVVHLRCTNLPRLIRISRHSHRLSFTCSFNQNNRSCGVCRRKIDDDYGGYSCIKKGCLYASHSKCATQTNVWDGIELEGVPEDIEEEEVPPFVRISDEIIQHFSHQQHHLQLIKNMDKDYDDNKQCQGCITPIYFGNFYSCLQCDFIMHEECATLSRSIHHPIHPHLLTLVGGYDGDLKYEDKCSACPRLCIAGFFYKCGTEGCSFKLHVQCATVSEPLVQESHVHPLFLTSKPGEQRACSVCKEARLEFTNETFNCIEDCDFALCFACATLPQTVRYKHDKHMLSLSYGKETSTMMYWCEVCEGKVNPKERFYICDEYCCVTIHIECLIGKDLYMKPGSSCFYDGTRKLRVLPNNHMSRPFCFDCDNRCLYKTVLQYRGYIFCSTSCIYDI